MKRFFTIGADVEVFGKVPNGNFIALCGKIGGTKEQPLQVKELPKGYMVQEDNVALEYNIPVCENSAGFVTAIRTMREYCKVKMKSLTLELSPEASVSFPVEELNSLQAQTFGCEPDFSAWTKTENPRPECEDRTLRTCGGHIHYGTDVDMLSGIRLLDLFLGVPSVLVDNSEASKKRRKLYGKAGAMRPKPYGFEYRVLSNFWMFDDYLVDWIYHNSSVALDSEPSILTKGLSKKVQECINSGKESLAEEIVKDVGIILPDKEKYSAKLANTAAMNLQFGKSEAPTSWVRFEADFLAQVTAATGTRIPAPPRNRR